MAVDDVDGDGFADVVAFSQFPSKLAWYRNNGDGTFGPQNVISTAIDSPTDIAVADFDGDGRTDVVCSSYLDNRIAWFRNVGSSSSSSSFDSTVRTISTNAYFATGVAVADINADGYPDILSTSYGLDPSVGQYVSKVALYLNNRNGTPGDFGPTATNQIVISNAGIGLTSIAVSDLDGNGLPDLVVTSQSDNTIAWFQAALPRTNGVPQYTRRVIASNQGRAKRSTIADIDGDGWPDIVCAAPFGNTITWFQNTTHNVGTVSPFFGSGQLISGNAAGVDWLATGDLNSDGRLDMLSATNSDGKIAWYENLGMGNFAWNPGDPDANKKVISPNASGAICVAASDFNHDGAIDVVSASQDDGKVAVYFNRGGQCALVSADTAPSFIGNGKRDDLLRIAISSRGVPGDNNARLDALTLLFEKSPGVPMTTAEANALIANLHVYVDSDNSTAFERSADTLVATVPDLQLTGGRQIISLPGGNPSGVQIPPGITRNFFVVAEMALNGSSQNPNTVRVTHVGQGAGRSIVKDAVSGAVLTVEKPASPDVPSSLVTVQLSSIQAWRQTWFGTTANSGNAADGANPDGDSDVNLVEFAFGTNPIVNQSGPISVSAGAISPGKPTVLLTNTPTGVVFQALYGRRKDYLTSELSYTVEFSGDLLTWVASTDNPAVVADNGVMQAVTIPYPLFISGKKARFFHVIVTAL